MFDAFVVVCGFNCRNHRTPTFCVMTYLKHFTVLLTPKNILEDEEGEEEQDRTFYCTSLKFNAIFGAQRGAKPL